MISSECLLKDQLVRFERIKRSLELAYNQVIKSLCDSSSLPYTPNIYPTPIMITRITTIHARIVRVLYYSVAYPDKNNFERLAIYPTLTLIERLPHHLAGVLGHEIAHIMALKGRVSISKSDLYSILRNREENDKSKEKKAEMEYKYFDEPILTKIIRWNRISMQKDIEEVVSNGIQQVNQQAFNRVIFKDKLENFHNFIGSKLDESERSSNTLT
jgi:hypothetical protein